MNALSQGKFITTKLQSDHPLIILKDLIPFKEIKDIVKRSLVKSRQGNKRDLDHHIRALIVSIYLNISSFRGLVESLDSNLYARFFVI